MLRFRELKGGSGRAPATQTNNRKEFLTFIQVEKGLARQTLESYANDLKRLESWSTKAGKALPDLTRADLRSWIASLSREGLAPSSIARAVSAARGFFRFLMIDGHIKIQPTEDLDTPQRFAYLPKFLTEEEIDRLFAAPDISNPEGVRDRTMIELMYAAGLRVSELIGLKQADIELQAGLLLCQGKGNKQRRVPIGKSAVHWLQRYATVKASFGTGNSPLLFLHRGRPVTRQFAWSMIKRYAAVRSADPPHSVSQFCNAPLAARADSDPCRRYLVTATSTTQIYRTSPIGICAVPIAIIQGHVCAARPKNTTRSDPMRRRLCHWLTLACLCTFPVIALGQAEMHQVKVGPYGDQVRIIDALATPAANGYKLQSLIVDITPAKNKRDQPLAVHVDLTATVRDMQTGKKDQQALVLRWAANGDFEVKCDGNGRQTPLSLPRW